MVVNGAPQVIDRCEEEQYTDCSIPEPEGSCTTDLSLH